MKFLGFYFWDINQIYRPNQDFYVRKFSRSGLFQSGNVSVAVRPNLLRIDMGEHVLPNHKIFSRKVLQPLCLIRVGTGIARID